LGSRQRLQGARGAAVVFHWARRERVLLRDIFRLGTATVGHSSVSKVVLG
jgi:hypothetical protein